MLQRSEPLSAATELVDPYRSPIAELDQLAYRPKSKVVRTLLGMTALLGTLFILAALLIPCTCSSRAAAKTESAHQQWQARQAEIAQAIEAAGPDLERLSK